MHHTIISPARIENLAKNFDAILNFIVRSDVRHLSEISRYSNILVIAISSTTNSRENSKDASNKKRTLVVAIYSNVAQIHVIKFPPQ